MTPAEAPPPLADVTPALAIEGVEHSFGSTHALEDVAFAIDVRQAMIDHVRGLCQREDIAVLWATHLIDEVRDGDRVIILHEGRVLAFGRLHFPQGRVYRMSTSK